MRSHNELPAPTMNLIAANSETLNAADWANPELGSVRFPSIGNAAGTNRFGSRRRPSLVFIENFELD